MIDLELNFAADLWVYPGKAAWFFITLPSAEAEQVRFYYGSRRRGWGAVRVAASIGDSCWKTSIFPDSRTKSYLLPVKAEIRKKQNIKSGDKVTVKLAVSVNL